MATWTETMAQFEARYPAHVGQAAIDLAQAHVCLNGRGRFTHDDDTRFMADIDRRGAEKYLRGQGFDPDEMRRLAAKVIRHWYKH